MSSQPTNEAGRQAWIRYSNRPTFKVRVKMVGNGWQSYERDVKQGPFMNLDWTHLDDWVKVQQLRERPQSKHGHSPEKS